MYTVIDRHENYTKLHLTGEPVFYHIIKTQNGYVYFVEDFTGPSATLIPAAKAELTERFKIEF